MIACIKQVGCLAEDGHLRLLNSDGLGSAALRSMSPGAQKGTDLSTLRGAGILRPGSLSQANRLAASLLLDAIQEAPLAGPSAILTCSGSSVFGISHSFELAGLASDWRLLDPFHLPNTIPTAMATSLARVSSEFVLAMSFSGTGVQVFRAIEMGLALVSGGMVNECVIIAAEEEDEVQNQAARSLGVKEAFTGTASLLRLACIQPSVCAAWIIQVPTGSSEHGADVIESHQLRQPNSTQIVIRRILEATAMSRELVLCLDEANGAGTLRVEKATSLC